MAFTNINDPAGVKSLLEQLRNSQAWQDTIQQAPADQPEKNKAAELTSTSPSNESERSQSISGEAAPAVSSVASLLSQLESSTAWPAAVGTSTPVRPKPNNASTTPIYTVNRANTSLSSASPPVLTPSQPTERLSTPRLDVRSYTFQQALPHLAQLSDDPNFVASLSQMKQQQDDLEQLLAKERRAIRAKHEEKVKVAQAKAKIFGAGLSKHEAEMMSDAYRKEMQKFDAERVLVAWDGLVAKQQAALENLRVPTMFVTNVKADREKQQRVVQVLEGISASDDT